MPVLETDHDLLQTYLDGELPATECEALWRRLATEPALAAALDQLRADRASRKDVWDSYAPSDVTAATVERRITSAAKREDVLSLVNRGLKFAGAAAACLFFGFAFGWIGHDKYPAYGPASMNVGNGPGAGSGSVMTVGDNLGGGGSGGGSARRVPAGNKVNVYVKDDSGKVIAVQQFDSLEDAQRFQDDFNRAQQDRHNQAHDNLVVPVSDNGGQF